MLLSVDKHQASIIIMSESEEPGKLELVDQPVPSFQPKDVKDVIGWIDCVQRSLDVFTYNKIAHELLGVDKSLPLWHVILCAQALWMKGLPMKCLEATALVMCLTNPLVLHHGSSRMKRFPLRFKTKVNGSTYWHIVTVIKFDSKFGSIGMSRQNTVSFGLISLTLTALHSWVGILWSLIRYLL